MKDIKPTTKKKPKRKAKNRVYNKEKIMSETMRPIFELGYSVRKACDIAGIPHTTVSTWIENDSDLRAKVTIWQNTISQLARKNWQDAIKHGKPSKFGPDKYTPAKDWLERREKKDFSTKIETDITTDGESLKGLIQIK